MPTLKFAVLAGDYIGPEVMTEALRVLEHVAKKENLTLSYQLADVGGAGIDNHGKALPDSTLAVQVRLMAACVRDFARAALTDKNDRLRQAAFDWLERHPVPEGSGSSR